MIGLVFFAHGGLGHALRAAMEDVVGPQRQCEVVPFNPDERDEDALVSLKAVIERCDTGRGVIVLNDLYGGGPSKLANQLLSDRLEVISGVNLPMMIRVIANRGRDSLADCADAARDAGRKYISVASDILAEDDAKSGETDMDLDARNIAEPPDTPPIEALERLVTDLNQLIRVLREQHSQDAGLHGRGHNHPPQLIELDPQTLEEGILAAAALESEMQVEVPKRQVLEFCLAILKKVYAAIKAIIKWLAEKADRFVNEAVDSLGKKAGTIVLTGTILSQTKVDLARVVQYLEHFLAGLGH